MKTAVSWRREVGWFLVNYALLNVYVFVVSAVQGVILLASSSDGRIPGWDGSAIEQIFWYAIAGVLFLSLVYGFLVLIVALLVWRLAVRLLGHPRLTAYIVATVMVLGAAALIERTEPLYLAIVLAIALGYATIVREATTARVTSDTG